MARINRKHFILFNNGGVISATTPKEWARAHQELFLQHDFSNSKKTPTVSEIEIFLTTQRNYSIISNTEKVILYQYSSI